MCQQCFGYSPVMRRRGREVARRGKWFVDISVLEIDLQPRVSSLSNNREDVPLGYTFRWWITVRRDVVLFVLERKGAVR